MREQGGRQGGRRTDLVQRRPPRQDGQGRQAGQGPAEEANGRRMAEGARIGGIPGKEIGAVAKELTSHGKKAVVDVHRGIAQHTNGFYNVLSAMTINLLLGNFHWEGGVSEE